MKNIFTIFFITMLGALQCWAAESREPVASGYLQENKNYSESVIYIRSATNYNREGYLSFGINDVSAVNSAILRLYPKDGEVRNNDLTQIDFYAGEGNLTEGLTWDTRPADLTVLGSVELATKDAYEGEYIELDITEYYNGLINAGSATFFTVKVFSETTNAYVQFVGGTSTLAELRPQLIVDSDCSNSSQKEEIVACKGTDPVIAGKPRSESGIYYDSLQSTCGADSVIIYELTLIESITKQEEVAICEGESYMGFSTSGEYTVSIVSDDAACEQVTEIVLTVNELPVVDLGEDFTINEDETVTLSAGSGFESYSWSDGTTGEAIVVSSEGFSSGDEISVTVTNANGCSSSDTVMVTIEENAIKPVRDGFVRESDDAYINTNALEVKYDQYGDLENPGNPPYWTREAYLAFDISELDQELYDVKLRLYLYNINYVAATPNEPVAVDVAIGEGLYEDGMTWTTKPAAAVFQSAATVTVSDEDVDTFIEFDINDFFQENIAGETDQFSIKISTYTDPNSTMVKFRSLDHTTDKYRPHLVYSLSFEEDDEETPPVTGIHDMIKSSDIQLFPNPVKNRIKVTTKLSKLNIAVYDMAGRILLEAKSGQDNIDVSALPSGVYLISISGKEGEIIERFVKE